MSFVVGPALYPAPPEERASVRIAPAPLTVSTVAVALAVEPAAAVKETVSPAVYSVPGTEMDEMVLTAQVPTT